MRPFPTRRHPGTASGRIRDRRQEGEHFILHAIPALRLRLGRDDGFWIPGEPAPYLRVGITSITPSSPGLPRGTILEAPEVGKLDPRVKPGDEGGEGARGLWAPSHPSSSRNGQWPYPGS